MQWKKVIIEDRFLAILALLGFLFIIFSFYLNSWLIFGSAMLIIMIALGNSYYLKHIGEGLLFENKREKNRFFIGDKGEWSLLFSNHGLPIMNARLTIYFDSAVVPGSGEFHIHQSKIEVSVPVSMRHKEKLNIKIPFSAEKRGMSRIRKMELHIPHFFGFGDTLLELNDIIRSEALVYPQPITVRNIDKHKSLKPGNNPAVLSLYEDNMGPVGTRDYISTDSFNRINWKASARKMTLQTKEFEKITEAGAVLFVNVTDGYSITGMLEFLMSSIAEMSYFLHKSSIPFALCMNVRSAGGTPFTYIPIGSGKDHLQKLLDILAMTDYHSPSIPYEKMIFFYSRHLPKVPTMIHAGSRTEESDGYFREFEREGIHILEMKKHEKDAFLQPLKVLKKEVAANE